MSVCSISVIFFWKCKSLLYSIWVYCKVRPLFYAILALHAWSNPKDEMIHYFLNHPQTDLSITDTPEKYTLLMEACAYDHCNIVKLLLNHPKMTKDIINMQDESGNHALIALGDLCCQRCKY